MGKLIGLLIFAGLGALVWQWIWPYTVQSKESMAAELERSHQLFLKEPEVTKASGLSDLGKTELERLYVQSKEKGWYKFDYNLFKKHKSEEVFAKVMEYEDQMASNAAAAQATGAQMQAIQARHNELWDKREKGTISDEEFKELAKTRNQTPVAW